MTVQLVESNYEKAKDIFSDIYDDDYVNIDSSVIAYEKLFEVINKPIKLVLLYGKPGTGKTFLLKKIYRDLSKKKSIILLPTPFFDELEFIKNIYTYSFKDTLPNLDSFDAYFKLITEKAKQFNEPMTVFIDEAQLYPSSIIEKIRLLADTRKYKIVFTVHKTDEKEDVFAKDYFKTRIWESVELNNITFEEFKIYIEKKFLYHNMFDFINKFTKKHYKIIYTYSKGNLRETNKILYKLFDICDYYDKKEPSKMSNRLINTKFLEMTIISLDYLNA